MSSTKLPTVCALLVSALALSCRPSVPDGTVDAGTRPAGRRHIAVLTARTSEPVLGILGFGDRVYLRTASWEAGSSADHPGEFVAPRLLAARLSGASLVVEDPIASLRLDEDVTLVPTYICGIEESRIVVRFWVKRQVRGRSGRTAIVVPTGNSQGRAVSFSQEGEIVENGPDIQMGHGCIMLRGKALPYLRQWSGLPGADSDRAHVTWTGSGGILAPNESRTVSRGLSSFRYHDIAYRSGGADPSQFEIHGLLVTDKVSGQDARYDTSTGLPSNKVSAASLRSNTLWVATFDAGLALVDLDAGATEPMVTEGLPKDLSALADCEDGLYVGTFTTGVYVLDTSTQQVHTIPGVLGNRVNCMTVHRGYLWVGTDRGVTALVASVAPPD